MKKLLRAAVACAVAGTMSVVGASSASAHATAVSGVAQCAVDGTIEVTWTIENDYPRDVAVSGEATGGGTLTGLPNRIPATTGNGNTSITATQSDIPVGGATAGLHVNTTWADGYTASASGQVSLPGECTPSETPVTPVTPVAPRIVQSDECDVEGFVTVPRTEGVRYRFDGKDVSGTTLTGPLEGTITVDVEEGFALTELAKTEFPVQVAAATMCDAPVAPIAPQVVQSDECDVEGFVTVPRTDGVYYLFDGKDVSGETLTGPLDGTITVEVKDGFVLAEGARTEFRVQVAPAAVCDTPVVPIAPQIVQSDECDVEGTVTIPEIEGVSYVVEDEELEPGTYEGPLDVTITAIAWEGYTLTGTSSWDVVLTESEVCEEEPTTPTTPTTPSNPSTPTNPLTPTVTTVDSPTPPSSDAPLAYTGAGDVAPLSLLAMGLLVLGGGLVMLKRRLGPQA